MKPTQHRNKPQLLLINPWIYDFAAFDLWMKPLGLLYLAGALRQHGYDLHLIDCLDRYNPELLRLQCRNTPNVKAYGTGKFFKRKIPKPAVVEHIPYPYCRYGITEGIFSHILQAVPRPDAILVTSLMTYWYPGVFRAIELVKQQFPDIPVVLGGVYATLCSKHAESHSGADHIVRDRDLYEIIRLVDEMTGYHPQDPSQTIELFDTYPAYDLYEHLDYAGILTSIGCPYRCTYCASQVLCPGFIQRPPEAVFQEISHLYSTKNIRNFAFYDDALLVNSSNHLEPLLKRIIESGLSCSFHTPNGLHARYITDRTAELMFQAGFKTLRLSLETTNKDRQQQTGGKVTGEEFQRAVEALQRAGFQGEQIGAYLFAGLPGQQIEETEATIHYVHELGVLAHLCEYSPIPGTPDWDTFIREGSVHPEDDPLLHNNSIFLLVQEYANIKQIQALKDLVRALNRRVKARA